MGGFISDFVRTGSNLDTSRVDGVEAPQHLLNAQVWLWVDDMGGPLGLINRRIGDGLVGYRWRAGGSNGLNMPEGYENWNRLQGQPDNGKLKGAISASLHFIHTSRLKE